MSCISGTICGNVFSLGLVLGGLIAEHRVIVVCYAHVYRVAIEYYYVARIVVMSMVIYDVVTVG